MLRGNPAAEVGRQYDYVNDDVTGGAALIRSDCSDRRPFMVGPLAGIGGRRNYAVKMTGEAV